MRRNSADSTFKYLPLMLPILLLSFLVGGNLSSCTALGQKPARERTIAIRIPREDAHRYLAGAACFPRAPQSAPDGLPVILRQSGLTEQGVAHALILALGAIPESHLIDLDADIPDNHRDLGVVTHRGHHPFRNQRLIAPPIRPVTFCQ